MHWLVSGQATEYIGLGESTAWLVSMAPVVGTNVTSSPLPSTAVHWLAAGGQSRPNMSLLPSTVAVSVTVSPGTANVTSRPPLPTAVHWLAVGQDTALSVWPGSIGVTVLVTGLLEGSNLTTFPSVSTP